MSFDDLPPLPPLLMPEARGYVERIMAASRAVQERARGVYDVPYGTDYWQKVDIYLPDDPSLRDLPVLCFLHGGAWTNGTKEWMGFMAPPVTAMPAVFVAANYRLAPAARYPAALDDTLDALAWIYRNIARHQGDPGRIFLGGHSAGGHLAALATLRGDLSRARGLPDDVVKACLAVSGAFDLRAPDPQPGSLDAHIYEFFLASSADDWEASPIRYVAANRTPFYLAWAGRDFPSLIPQNRAMAAALKAEAGPLAVDEFLEFDHFAINEDAARPESRWVRRARRWMAGDLS